MVELERGARSTSRSSGFAVPGVWGEEGRWGSWGEADGARGGGGLLFFATPTLEPGSRRREGRMLLLEHRSR